MRTRTVNLRSLAGPALSDLAGDDELTLTLEGEHSVFLRFNDARGRQLGSVSQGRVQAQLTHQGRSLSAGLELGSNAADDARRLADLLAGLRQVAANVPEDPFRVPAVDGANVHSTSTLTSGKLPVDPVSAVLEPAHRQSEAALDLTGIYAGGTLFQSVMNSRGLAHEFETENFALDLSLSVSGESPLVNHMVKGRYAGSDWSDPVYHDRLEEWSNQARAFDLPMRTPDTGPVRAYLAPAAVASLVGMFSWEALSERALMRGNSALGELRRGQRLSERFSLFEDFEDSGVPLFNELGEVPEETTRALISQGELTATLVSSATAREFSVQSNQASAHEALRAPRVATGKLPTDTAEILRTLGDGLFISDLHYLNWSDRSNARVTGLTRYACFEVRAGQLAGPIPVMRFDDSLFELFGSALIDLTAEVDVLPDVDTYGGRKPGGARPPGLLLERLNLVG